MPNGKTHMLVGAGVGLGVALIDQDKHSISHNPAFGTVIGAISGKLPDMIEPALNPHHRQFFHSYLFMTVSAAAMFKVYKWSPDTPFEKLMRGIALIGGCAYLSHLICDSTTPKGLPLVGKL
ncbi:metal-dependent hydrolase [Pseudoalteromonas phenolica]|uniref:metal-dependent hydrolase n=1 Tax=Pseudoalteromonas phenolica TaxID=161398 RepID=UPI00384F1CDD